jgi:nucleoside-diphosphate-sugar epimerase
MKVLVTGGTGFIGSWVVGRLLEDGHTPIIFDHHKRTPADIGGMFARETHAVKDYIEVFWGDMRDDVAVTEAMAHAEGFIHLAGVLGTQETITNPRPAAMSNLQGGLNVLEAAAQYDIPGVYIGVGNHWMDNTYSISKTMVERFVKMFNAHRGTRANIVRAMNAYGPGQSVAAPYGSAKVRKITPSFICRALHGHDIEIYGDGEQISDMVWVGDVATALVQAMYHAKDGNVCEKPVEVGPVTSNTVNAVADLIVKLTDSPSKIVHLPMRPGEVPGAAVYADVETQRQIGLDPHMQNPMNP